MAKKAKTKNGKTITHSILTPTTFKVESCEGNNLVSPISIAGGILVLMHHLVFCSTLFDVRDVLHQEFFAGVFIAFRMGAFLFRAKSKQ